MNHPLPLLLLMLALYASSSAKNSYNYIGLVPVLGFQCPISRTRPSSASSSTSPLFRRTNINSRKGNPVQSQNRFQNQSPADSNVNNLKNTNIHVVLSSTKENETENNPNSTPYTNVGLGAWIPLASASALHTLGPQRITIMNIDLVVWHDESSNQWSAQLDACPHRLAPLSQGRVDPVSNCIECPYHGWQFDTHGKVQSVPQLDERANGVKNDAAAMAKNQPGMNLLTFPVRLVNHDLLFVFLPSEIHGEAFPVTLLPEDYYPFLKDDEHEKDADGSKKGTGTKTKKIKKPKPSYFIRELPYSFDFLVENFMDPAHIPFAHHKLQSTRDDGSAISIKHRVSNFTHVEVYFRDISAKRRRDAYASFQRPSFYHYSERKGDIVNEETGERSGEWQPSLPIFVAPVRAGECRVFLISPNIALFGGLVKIPNWLMHAGSNRFLNSDSWLHDTEREVLRRKEMAENNANGKTQATASTSTSSSTLVRNMDAKNNVTNKLCQMDYQYASKSDMGVSAFRKWWRDFGMADSPPHTFRMSSMEELGPLTLSRSQQIDPWTNHAAQCSTCRGALVKMKKLQTVSIIASILSVVLGSKFQKYAVGAVGAGCFLLVHNFLKRFATVIEGNSYASGIADRSAAASAP